MAIGIIGTLLGVIIAYFLSLSAAKLQWHRIAGAKLRAAFAPQVAQYDLFRDSKMLTMDGMTAADKMFKDSLPLHAAAIEEHRPFVPSKNRQAYQKAWEDYKDGVISGDYWEGENRKNIFKQKIEAIFKFIEI